MLIPLKLVRDQQLQQQIFDQLRDLIVSRRLLPGARMPSSRMMAEQFAISRITVLLTYERLIAEGYLETRPAAGTFVAHSPPGTVRAESFGVAAANSSALSLAHPPDITRAAPPPNHTGPNAGHDRGGSGPETDIRVGGADPSLFPAQRWRSLMRSGLDRMGALIGADNLAGTAALRDAIAGWLSTSRGLAVSPDQVMVMRGRQQALHLVAHLASHPCEGRRATVRSGGCPIDTHATGLGRAHEERRLHPAAMENHAPAIIDREPGLRARTHGEDSSRTFMADHARIVVEDPCDPDSAAAMAGEGAILVRVPIDADGIRTDRLPPGDAALIHVTPEHQRPLGAILARDRRTTLLHWAGDAGALVLEEDIVGELRYGSMTVPSLMSLDRSERVILLGGFAVSLGPWVDIAYLVMPRWLMPFALAARRLIDDSRGTLEQSALAEFLSGGGYARHLHRVSRSYASRRDTLLDAMRRHAGDTPLVWGQHAGLHLAWFPPPDIGVPATLAPLARHCGLEAAALPAGTPGAQALLLGFGLLPERQIEARFARFAGMMRTDAPATIRSA